MYFCIGGPNMITNHGLVCHLHSNCRKQYIFMMCVNGAWILSFLTLLVAYGRISQHDNPTGSCVNHLTVPSLLPGHGSEVEKHRGGVPSFGAAAFRDASICDRTAACYRLASTFYVGSLFCTVHSSSADSQPVSSCICFPLCWFRGFAPKWRAVIAAPTQTGRKGNPPPAD